MARLTAQQYLDKWGQNLGASSEYIKAGVNRVQEAPGAAAARAADRMAAGVAASVASGTWQRRVSSVSLQQWRDAMVNKGIPRLAQGIAGAKQNKVGQITALLAAVDNAAAQANALPKGGLEQGIARATTFMRAMSQNAPKRAGGNQ